LNEHDAVIRSKRQNIFMPVGGNVNEPEETVQRDAAPALSPFDWTEAGHVLVRAGEAVNWDVSDLTGFIKRVQSIEYGLSAEIEFAAIVSWLGRCSLAHRLDQDYFSSHSTQKWCVPDLFAIFEHAGVRAPVLIEVKTRKRERLVLRTSDLESMQRYASAVSLPLLIAWKPRRLGFWLLVDPIHFERNGAKSILGLEASLKNNLLSSVAGDFLVVPKPNAGIYIEAKIIEKTRRTKKGFGCLMRITKAEFRNALGEPVETLPWAIEPLLFSCMEVVEDVTEDEVHTSFITGDQPIHAQQILRTAVAFCQKGTKTIRWRHVAKDLDAFLSRDVLHDEIQHQFGTFVQYQFFQHPQVWPHFLPAVWNAIPCEGKGTK
jgi:Holliday junction resolvase